MVNDAHEPDPRWDCPACGKAWPCDPARERMRIEYAGNPVGLGEHMFGRLGQATSVLHAEPPAVLFARFIAWTR